MKKLIIVILLLITSLGYSQTKDLSQLIAEYNQKATEYPKFVYQGIILNGSYDIFPSPYSPMQYYNGKYNLYLYKTGGMYIGSSLNGLNNWSLVRAYFPYGSVMFYDNKHLVAFHEWFNNQSFFYFGSSLNGIDYTTNSFIREPHGEDITFLRLANGKYRAYGRMQVPPAIRTVGVMESDIFTSNWSPLVEILAPDPLDNQLEFYSMSVVQTQLGFFGFVNTFNPTNDKMTVRLVFSEDGITNWQRLNNRQPVLPLGDRKQLYASASVIGDYVYITTISAKFGHSESDRNGRFYYTELWKISLTDLYKFLN